MITRNAVNFNAFNALYQAEKAIFNEVAKLLANLRVLYKNTACYYKQRLPEAIGHA